MLVICAPSLSAFMHLVCLGPYEISVILFKILFFVVVFGFNCLK